MSTAEALHHPAAEERQPVTPDTWPAGVPRNGVELSQELDQIRGPNFGRRMQMMQEDGPAFAELKALEDQLTGLTYSPRPFTNPEMAGGLAQDLQRLRDLYGMGNPVGRAVRNVRRRASGWLAKAEQQPVAE